MSVFVDTSVFYAAADRSDGLNGRAKKVLGRTEAFVTSNYILLESWRLIAYRIGWQTAEDFWGGLRSGPVKIENVSDSDLEVGWRIGREFTDQEFSLTDRTSFALMERLGISRAASFDNDFAIYRYGSKRDLAFEIVSG